MMIVTAKEDADKVIAALHAINEKAPVIGEIVEGHKGVILCQD